MGAARGAGAGEPDSADLAAAGAGGGGWAHRGTLDEQRPATYSHDAAQERVEWLPPREYRRWRDIGERGFTVEGLPDVRFRGRWAARNATFCDLMVRTGLRLSEQTALTRFEVPLDRGLGGYQRFWLPSSIAKGGSARWVYVPASVIADLAAYAAIDRLEVIADAQRRYRGLRRLLVVEDPARPVATLVTAAGVRRRVKVAQLDPEERRRFAGGNRRRGGAGVVLVGRAWLAPVAASVEEDVR